MVDIAFINYAEMSPGDYEWRCDWDDMILLKSLNSLLTKQTPSCIIPDFWLESQKMVLNQ